MGNKNRKFTKNIEILILTKKKKKNVLLVHTIYNNFIAKISISIGMSDIKVENDASARASE